ncbi:hypothetical protein BVX98_05390 [bacterium F11]|nr:hypothetical protein BVX98_05390 [bacterium F11]
MASNRGTPASSSENPASLVGVPASLFVTTFVGETTVISSSHTKSIDSLQNKVLQFISVAGENGVIFFEPLGRREVREYLTPINSPSDSRDIAFSANALGFGGAQKFGKDGSFGLSIAYLRGTLSQSIHHTGVPDESKLDTGDGVRLNLGIRYPTGPAMWGLVLKNFPGFLWWKNHRRQLLPVTIQAGHTYRVRPGTLLSLEVQQLHYHEGSRTTEIIRSGFETQLAERISIRGGIFTDEINESKNHHYTGGITLESMSGVLASGGVERFKINDEKVIKTYISLTVPFDTGKKDGKR